MAAPVTRRRLAGLGILLTLVLFAAVGILANGLLTRYRLDLTEEQRFTLAPATAQLAVAVEEPIVLRLYLSQLLVDLNPAYATHATRVRDLLEAFVRLSGGRIRLEVYDPEPFSPEEDLAVADGIEPLALGGGTGDQVYFGLVGRNATDDTQAIPFLSPERAGFLEYDVARMVSSLARPEKGKVGLMGAISLMGDQSTGFRPRLVYQLLEQLFAVEPLQAQDGRIPDAIEVLRLVQPERLSEAQLYALDQFVLRGGRLLLFADPFSEEMAAANPQPYMPPMPADLTAVAPLFEAWGFSLAEGEVAADRLSARRVLTQANGRQVVTDYVAWLGLPTERLAQDDPTTANLTILFMNSAGALSPAEGATTSFLPLVSTSAEAALLPVARVAVQPDPVRLLAEYQPGGTPLVLAARIEGPARSAFPDGPPALQAVEGLDFEALTAAHRSDGEVRILAVSDTDLLMDRVWTRADQSAGGIVPLANNADLLLNGLEDLSGGVGLTALRGRGLVDRPFTVVEALQREAEQRYRKHEQELMDRIQAAQTEIGEIEQDAEGGVVLNDEQEATVERLRQDLLAARRELREVQRGLRDDLETLVRRISLVNIAGVPLVLAVIGLGVALVRRRRAQRRSPA